ncbi:hypothetical protein T440DRAFT_517134 [Plenodomus tracheiphilus IPT5]|uniref:Uncharacterized protein n=1 Tax=Plenodomus tracheiphilus IPT5 TaxID=1408161 RepID=A0A6A7B7X3_9PLEO|nr:hypothetical protein T440DRAFT_517134 [Plenodomus tracheiphilus IPT5]
MSAPTKKPKPKITPTLLPSTVLVFFILILLFPLFQPTLPEIHTGLHNLLPIAIAIAIKLTTCIKYIHFTTATPKAFTCASEYGGDDASIAHCRGLVSGPENRGMLVSSISLKRDAYVALFA